MCLPLVGQIVAALVVAVVVFIAVMAMLQGREREGLVARCIRRQKLH